MNRDTFAAQVAEIFKISESDRWMCLGESIMNWQGGTLINGACGQAIYNEGFSEVFSVKILCNGKTYLISNGSNLEVAARSLLLQAQAENTDIIELFHKKFNALEVEI
jgi:hypothetical protein